ncbi:hypothetical protein C8Q74DRAFT_1257325 [Fomes fomentarius]|nr:hypothetical protein C8Q74DRAFT_1257325 [Fomes fomentarius]
MIFAILAVVFVSSLCIAPHRCMLTLIAYTHTLYCLSRVLSIVTPFLTSYEGSNDAHSTHESAIASRINLRRSTVMDTTQYDMRTRA